MSSLWSSIIQVPRWWYHPGNHFHWCCFGCMKGMLFDCVRVTGKWSREYPTLLEPCLERTLCVFPDWHSLWRGHNNMTREGRGSGLFVWHPLSAPLGSDIVWIFSTFLSGDLALTCPPQSYRSSDSSHPREWGEQKENSAWGVKREEGNWIRAEVFGPRRLWRVKT